jgi:hypothetical protein
MGTSSPAGSHAAARRTTALSITAILAGWWVVTAALTGTAGAGDPIRLQAHDAGFYKIDVPRGWDIITAGQCADFAFVLRDPAEPMRQVFFFGEVGPVYMLEGQRAIDQQYVQYGGYPVAWLDMPVVAPLTPANFLAHFQQIAASQAAQRFMPQAPRLSGFQPIAQTEEPCPITGGLTHLVRGLFTLRERVGEGLFLATVAPATPYTGGPGGGTAFGFLIAGVTAPQEEFAVWEPLLVRSLQSFTVQPRYVESCLQQQAATYSAIRAAGRVLDDTADLIMQGWEERNRSDDIISAKRSDAIVGRDRVYDPDTGTVYEVDPSFYDRYDINRGRFEMSNLQRLPADDYGLWTSVPLPGDRHIH